MSDQLIGSSPMDATARPPMAAMTPRAENPRVLATDDFDFGILGVFNRGQTIDECTLPRIERPASRTNVSAQKASRIRSVVSDGEAPQFPLFAVLQHEALDEACREEEASA